MPSPAITYIEGREMTHVGDQHSGEKLAGIFSDGLNLFSFPSIEQCEFSWLSL